MTIEQLKKAVDDLASREKPDTPVEIALWNGRNIEIGKVFVGVYTDGTKKIHVHEK